MHDALGAGWDTRCPFPRLALNPASCFDCVAVGDLHTCALLYGGVVTCWGGNDDNLLGYDAEQVCGGDIVIVLVYMLSSFSSRVVWLGVIPGP